MLVSADQSVRNITAQYDPFPAAPSYHLTSGVVPCAPLPESNYGTPDPHPHPPVHQPALSIHLAYFYAPQPHSCDDVTHYPPP